MRSGRRRVVRLRALVSGSEVEEKASGSWCFRGSLRE